MLHLLIHRIHLWVSLCGLALLLGLSPALPAATVRQSLPVATPEILTPVHADWLVKPIDRKAGVYRSEDGHRLILTNGLIRRVWLLEPNAACVALDDLTTGRSLLRAVKPETRLVVNGKGINIGGLTGQPDHAYLAPEWVKRLKTDPEAFRFISLETGEPRCRLAWKQVRHHAPDVKWPPAGVALRLDFAPGEKLARDPVLGRLRVSVHYEMYDGVPVMEKWITVHNGSGEPVNLDRFTSEILAVVEHGNPVDAKVPLSPPDSLHVETDYAFGGSTVESAARFSVHWLPDPDYITQVNWERKLPCLLEVKPEVGPEQTIAPGKDFESFRTFELVYDSTERDRRGLALRRMYRVVAPWVTENPLILHVTSTDLEVVKNAIDQAADCGFEMVSLSFGSGLNMEDESEANLAKLKALNDYAGSKGIEMGGYSLLSSRRIQPDSDNIINPKTGKPGGQRHGFCPALASNWGRNYFRKLYRFFTETGFRQFTHDGSYPGDLDAAARPPLQKGVKDSRWVQWKIITRFYRWLRARGVYLRVPDYYFLSGSNESGMGYREKNWSLPRIQQQIHTRQNIYDGTWEKTPSMGWMFVPLTEYHGGGAAATIEPLDKHRRHYELMMAGNLGAGVQAVYRGFRLYDTPRTRDLVKKWVDWYKQYRDILESDIIHDSSRRADGRDLDWYFHANSRLARKGMLVVFNPLARTVSKTIRLNLYYTGIEKQARIREDGSVSKTYQLDRRYRISLPVTVEAKGTRWFVIE